MASKLCDSCKSTPSTVFCRADSAFLCLTCDSEIHVANKLASRHARVWVCEVCEQAPAHVTCKADAAALCVTCDLDIHSANPLARRHERVPVTPFYEGGSSLPHPLPGNFFPEEEEEEAEAASWLLPNPNNNNNNNIHNTNNNNKMMVEDPYLDLEYCVKEEEEEEEEEEGDAVDQEGNSWGSDGVVPVQSGVGLVGGGGGGGGGGVGVFNCFGFNTTPCFSNTVSSSSLDVGVVPDGADISNPYSNHHQSMNQTVPLSGVDREARVMRYREKRKNRRFEKTIRYASRKAYAETRPRIKGRFAKRTDIDTTSSTSLDADDATAALFGFGVVPSFSQSYN